MSCSPLDLRDYVLEELTAAERRQVENHLLDCGGCREEVERLRATRMALLSLRDEEIPQRIGFVSDKVFEPSALGRWWSAFWGSAARLGFASAAMLSVAILVAALTRPAPIAAPAPPNIDLARMEADFSRRTQAAVERAVAQSEARQAGKTAALLAEVERRNELDRKAVMLAMEENLEVMRKRLNRVILASADYGAPR